MLRFLPKNITFLFTKYWQKFSTSKYTYYEILGVSNVASQLQIKKAYYKLAQQHHPDKNNSPSSKDTFSEINNAYQILSDEQKRNVYDRKILMKANTNYQHQYTNTKNSRNYQQYDRFQGMNMNFQDIFQDVMFREDKKKRNYNQSVPKKIKLKVTLDFIQSIKQTQKKLVFNRKIVCTTCLGAKAKIGTVPQNCNHCHGIGYVTTKHGLLTIKSICNVCHGQAKIIKEFCSTCNGTGIQNKQVQQTIQIPAGIHNNASLKFKGKGHLKGDLEIDVIVKQHPKFRRQKFDIHSIQEVSIIDAVLGGHIQIQTVHGTTKRLKIPLGCQNEETLILLNEGLNKKNSQKRGNHIVKIVLTVPKQVSDEQKILFGKLKQMDK